MAYREQDIQRWLELQDLFLRGGLPDVGKCDPKFGFRVSVGVELKNGKRQTTRYNLGRDKLTAQYRARELFEIWFAMVTKHQDGSAVMPADARERAFKRADEDMGLPAKRAARFNAVNAEAAISPGFKLVAVPVAVADDHAGKFTADQDAEEEATGQTLHSTADLWIAHLDKRCGAADLSHDYVSRAKSVVKNLKLASVNKALADLKRDDLEAIRFWYQAKLSKAKADGGMAWWTVKTECNVIRAFFRWCDDCGHWTVLKQWEKLLTPANTAQSEDRDDHDDAHQTYTLCT